MDADGKNVRPITDAQISSTAPQFSPDGLWIAYNQKEADASANYIVPAEGGAAYFAVRQLGRLSDLGCERRVYLLRLAAVGRFESLENESRR